VAGKDLGLAIKRQMIAYLATSTWASIASVAMPPVSGRCGAGPALLHPHSRGSRNAAGG
jgi:hypothetical protein